MVKGPEYTSLQRRHTNIQQGQDEMLNITNHQGNAKQKPQWATTSHLLDWLSSKRQEVSACEDVEKMELLCTVHGNVNWCGHYDKQCESSSKN